MSARLYTSAKRNVVTTLTEMETERFTMAVFRHYLSKMTDTIPTQKNKVLVPCSLSMGKVHSLPSSVH